MLQQAMPLTAEKPQGYRAEFRATLALAWPLILTNLTMSLIGATDVLMVGWLGPTELAASSLGFNLSMLLAIFGMGLVMGASPLMASEIGRFRHSVRDIRRTFRQTLWLVAMLSVPLLIILWNTGAILTLLGQDARLSALAQDYIRAYMWSIPLFLTTLAFRNFLAALERPRWSLIVGVVGVLGNILFNYSLIFGKFGMPALGVVGAGVGSVLTNLVMVALMIVVVYRDRQFRRYHLLGRWWRSDWPRFAEMTRIGSPIAISHAFEAGVFTAAVMLMGWISTAAVAAHAVALQLASLTFMVPMGLAQAATVRVGIGHGRGDAAHIRRAGWTSFAMGTGFMAVMALMFELNREQNTTLVLVTHDLDDATTLADDLLVLDGGNVLQAGPVQEVLRAPASEVVRAILDLGEGTP